MITSRQLTEQVKAALNALAAEEGAPFIFRLYSEVGEFEAAQADPTRRKLPTPIINGVMMTLPSQIVPVQGVKSFMLSQLLTLYVPVKPNPTADGTDEGIDEAKNIITNYVAAAAGSSGVLEDSEKTSFSYVMTPQLPSVGTESYTLGFKAVPVSISFVWQFIEGGVIGNNIQITVNGKSAVLLEGGEDMGLVTGEPEGVFAPADSITWEQAAALEPGSLAEVDGVPYEVQVAHTLDRWKTEYEIVRVVDL